MMQIYRIIPDFNNNFNPGIKLHEKEYTSSQPVSK
jgi:hypothetical protein